MSIQPLIAVTLCRWPCRLQVGSELPVHFRPAHDTASVNSKIYSNSVDLKWLKHWKNIACGQLPYSLIHVLHSVRNMDRFIVDTMYSYK